MVKSIQYFPRSRKRLFIGAYVVLVRGLRVAVTENLGDFFPAQSSLNQPRASRSSQAAKTQTVWFAVRNSGSSTRSLKRSFDSRDAKHKRVIILTGLLPQRFELKSQSITYRRHASLHSFRVERPNVNDGSANVSPLQLEDFACSHSGIYGADKDRSKVFGLSDTGGQQSGFFCERENARAFAFIGHRNQRVTFAKRTSVKPSFALSDIEQSSQRGEFPMHAGNASAFTSPCDFLQSVVFVGLKISVRDGIDRAVAEMRNERFCVTLDGRSGAHSRDLSIVNIDRIDRVAFQVPFHHVRELRGGAKLSGRIERLSFLQRFAKPVASFSLIFTGAPDGFTLSVLDPCNAGTDVPVSGHDLNLVVAGHLLSGVLYIEKITADWKRNRETDCDGLDAENQERLKAIDVLRLFGQDSDIEIDLTSNQKVAGSSPAGCIKASTKINLPKVRRSLNGFAIRRAIPSRWKSVHTRLVQLGRNPLTRREKNCLRLTPFNAGD